MVQSKQNKNVHKNTEIHSENINTLKKPKQMEERCMRIIRIQLHEKKMKVQHEIVNGLEGIQLGAPIINQLDNTKKKLGEGVPLFDG